MARRAKSMADVNRQYGRIVALSGGGYNSSNTRRIKASKIRDAYESNISKRLGRSVLGSYLDFHRRYSKSKYTSSKSAGVVAG